MSKKVLYFEGAGWSKAENNGVGNCRVRTAFLNNKGEKIYLELIGCEKNGEWKTVIDFAFNIDKYLESRKNNGMVSQRHLIPREYSSSLRYDKKAITNFINRNFNCNFETMEVLDNMEGYRVHAGNGEYNLMDNHILNTKRTEARNKAYNEVDEYFRKKLNERYSVVSLLKMEDDIMIIRCHASKEKLAQANMTNEDREKTIKLEY